MTEFIVQLAFGTVVAIVFVTGAAVLLALFLSWRRGVSTSRTYASPDEGGDRLRA